MPSLRVAGFCLCIDPSDCGDKATLPALNDSFAAPGLRAVASNVMGQSDEHADDVTPQGGPGIRPDAAILGWLLPGLGHMRLGQVRRGRLIMLGVLFLFFTGVLVGGVDVVDRKQDALWFAAQVMCGPVALAADFANQSLTKPLPPAHELQEAVETNNQAVLRKMDAVSLGHVNEMGTLFCALAGLMNLAAMLDALHFVPRPASSRLERRSAVP